VAKFSLQKLLEDPAAKAAEAPPLDAPPAEEFEVRRFLHAFLYETGFNITAAYLAIRPHVLRKTAANEGSLLLKRPDVQRLLAEVTAAAWQRQEIDRDYVIGGWVALSRGNVYDYFDEDDAGRLVLRKKSSLPVEIQRNVKKLKVRTFTYYSPKTEISTTEQVVELELHDRKAAFDSLARAGGLFGDLEQDTANDVAKAIEQGFARVARKLGRGLEGSLVQEGVIIGDAAGVAR
jgi:hypothetical protein